MITLQRNVPGVGVNVCIDSPVAANAAGPGGWAAYWGAWTFRDMTRGHSTPGSWRYTTYDTSHAYGTIVRSNILTRRGRYRASAWVVSDIVQQLGFSFRLEGHSGGGESYGLVRYDMVPGAWTFMETTYDVALRNKPLRVCFQITTQNVPSWPPANTPFWADEALIARLD